MVSQYQKLRNLKQQFYHLQVMAISGSISPFRAKEIALFLGISGCKFITKNPDRKNIFYTIQPKTSTGLPGDIIGFLERYVMVIFRSGFVHCSVLILLKYTKGKIIWHNLLQNS